jgi:UPF0716 family protein affecting phage T7 exclusion
MLLTLLLVNASALAGVLLMSRYSVTLVDERGETLARGGEWQERVVARRGAVREKASTHT